MPSVNAVHVNRPLTQISVAYLQDASKYISSQVFSNLPVDKKSDVYFKYDKGDFFRDEVQDRAPGTVAAEMTYDISQDSYLCASKALSVIVTDEEMANADDPLDPKRDATEILSQKVAIHREKAWASEYFKTGIWQGSTSGGDITPTNLWDTVSGDPVKDIGDQIDAMEEKTGFTPNRLVLPKKVFRALQNNEDIKDRLKYTGVPSNTTITADMLAALFGVERVLIARATNNIKDKNVAGDATMQYIFNSTQAGLFYAEQSPSIKRPSAGYTFSWRLFGGNDVGARIKDYRLEERDGDKVQADLSYDHKLVAADCGVFFDGVIS